MAQLDLKIPSLKLPDGNEIPVLAYGTGTAWFKKQPGDTDKKLVESIKTAIGMGYYHLDGAEVYNTELELGKAIKESGIAREKLFVTTKCNNTTSNIQEHFDESLKKLGLDHVELYLLHQPFDAKGDKTILQKAWAAMEQIAASGKAKSIGVSNFLQPHIEAILETAQTRPAINQIEYHPYLQHGDLIAYHKAKDIRLSAYAPQVPVTKVPEGPLTPLLDKLSRKYAVNPGEILLRWVLDQDIVAITTSSKEQRMSDMLRTVTFTLTPKELSDISEVGNSFHYRAFWTHIFDAKDRS
ncbi:hypothetical protein LTS08_004785 [Lithohypha guttulata]|uniref:D-xylose reductase [NAD(P)H] n=1 Tax=Lithohypha guttulata TaxID=1690604 RepID=A0AAN7YHZ0_9EURO|nr:hypothetical protein LTR05_002373 [Lithohypha guttulata]KAK5101179.1 hypothetical protein LTS08_004785 [Lithohypha guttulata]